MTLSLKGTAARASDVSKPVTLLTHEGDLVALIHDPHYALLFAHVEEMHELLVAVGTGACDVDYRGNHSRLCKTCAARSLLSKLMPGTASIRTN